MYRQLNTKVNSKIAWTISCETYFTLQIFFQSRSCESGRQQIR